MKIGKIENGVPLPLSNRRKKYPFDQMEVGQSFHVTLDTADEISKFRSVACWYGKRHDKKLVVRQDDTGCRCWRVK